MHEIIKYPRTHHIEGSRLQPGDENLEDIPFTKLSGRFTVIEEKVDGSNCGISFTSEGKMYLQSRGHYLEGGGRERHFNLFKTWANTCSTLLWEILKDRYIMYGEWLYAKHTVFYDLLPHYFMEFDIYDKTEKKFLTTEKRMDLLKNYKFITSVPVLFKGKINSYKNLTGFIGKSNFISHNHMAKLQEICKEKNISPERVLKETDGTNIMEGIYIKVEDEFEVKERCKYIRNSFFTSINNSETHWLERPIIPNLLRKEVDIFK